MIYLAIVLSFVFSALFMWTGIDLTNVFVIITGILFLFLGTWLIIVSIMQNKNKLITNCNYNPRRINDIIGLTEQIDSMTSEIIDLKQQDNER